MRPDDAAPARRLPKARSSTAKAHAPLRVLSLTGGGYRGLFSAQVLVQLCEHARRPGRLDRAFDVFAGTSIGGLMACALAVGVPPRRVLDAIDAYGPRIFPPRRQRSLRRLLFGALFDAHPVGGMPMLDGALAANNPDVLALMEISRRWPQRYARIEMLSIGTAGADTARKISKASKSGAGWAPELANFMITVQESTAAAQARRLLGERYLRVNHTPTRRHPAFENLDIANDDARSVLLEAGAAAARAAYRGHARFIDRLLADRRRG